MKMVEEEELTVVGGPLSPPPASYAGSAATWKKN